MNGSSEMTAELISGINDQVFEKALNGDVPVDVLVCPPAPYLSHAVESAGDNASRILVGSQNVSPFEKGAYTGEVSLPMLDDLGCQYVLLGHSERRHVFGETNESVAEKFAACAASETNIIPVLCVG